VCLTPTVTPTGDDSPEDRFAKLRNASDAIAQTASQIHVKALDPLSPESYPAATVIKLERQATLEFRAGLALLGDPVLAYAAEIQLRSMLDALAQLWRIYGMQRSSIASRRRRAICFEFGAMGGLLRSVRPRADKKGRRPPPRGAYTSPEARETIGLSYKDVHCLHASSCPPECQGTTASGIHEVLAKMSRRHKSLRWALPLYEVSSMTSHNLLQRGLAAADPSTMAIVPMDLPERAAMYDRLLTAYAQSIELAGQIHMAELAAFRPAALALKEELAALYRELGIA
jgi:hypothetical protein